VSPAPNPPAVEKYMNATIAPQPDLVTEADVDCSARCPRGYRQLADALGRRIVGQTK